MHKGSSSCFEIYVPELQIDGINSMKKYLRVTMPDSSQWDVPIKLIALDRATYYLDKHPDEFETVDEALEDTIKLFESDDFEIEDWAVNNMEWNDVEDQAVRVEDPEAPDYYDGWINGTKEIIS